LKRLCQIAPDSFHASPPMRERGLKHHAVTLLRTDYQSLPMRERGLKHFRQ
jgi:hypothetical protein